MAPPGQDVDVENKGDVVEQRRGDDSGSADEKATSLKVEDAVDQQPRRRLEPPPFIASLTPERRQELEKKLKRKIDWRLLPAVIIMYIMNYIDRNNIAAAKLAGIERDLHLTPVEFQTSISILFVGYLLMQIPSNLLLNKLGKPALYLPTCVSFTMSSEIQPLTGCR
jgi:hypothetical protein